MRSRAATWVRERPGACLALLAAGFAALAWSRRFVQDDAFISFRYARHLAQGHGLVFNPGQAVEGYTNFLWTLLLSAGFAAGLDPVVFSQILGVAAGMGALAATAALATHLTGSRGAGLAAAALLAANASFAAWSTGGLETSLHALLLASTALLGVRRVAEPAPRPAALAALSLASAAALMSRLDAALHLAAVHAFLAIHLVRTRGGRLALAGWLAPGAAAVGVWLGWKLAFYGSLVPNTWAAKVGSGAEPWLAGLFFAVAFAHSYLLWPLLALAAVAAPRVWRAAGRGAALVATSLLLQLAYLIRVGGDFMEFRLLVPLLPLAFALGAFAVCAATRRPLWRAAVAAWVLAGSLHHALRFEGREWIESVPGLAAHLRSPRENWIGIGRALGELCPGQDLGLATTAVGAIPYHSGLRTLDMHGLTDPEVARHGIPRPQGWAPGHQRLARFDQLLRQEVHLVVGHPFVARRRDAAGLHFRFEDLREFQIADARPEAVPADAPLAVLEIPLDAEYAAHVLYLRRHPCLDRAVREGRLVSRPVARHLAPGS